MGKIGLERSIHLVGLERSQKALLEGYSRLVKPATFLESHKEESQKTTTSVGTR